MFPEAGVRHLELVDVESLKFNAAPGGFVVAENIGAKQRAHDELPLGDKRHGRSVGVLDFARQTGGRTPVTSGEQRRNNNQDRQTTGPAQFFPLAVGNTSKTASTGL